MTTIFYETLPVAEMTFEGKWRLDYDRSGKRAARLSQFR